MNIYQAAYAIEFGEDAVSGPRTMMQYCKKKTGLPMNGASSSSHSSPFIGKLIIFVNPCSGNGKGAQTFHRLVEPSLRSNKIDYELIMTKGPGHARNIVEERDLGEFNAILILSGDGLVFEVLNGMFNRKDYWEMLHVLPIAIVPSGSGNGLLSSVFAHRGHPLKNPAFNLRAIELIASPECKAQPINLIHAQTRDSNFAAFLSVGWGLMADIDIESERFRKSLGSNRFIISALLRCFNLRTYQGRLSYRKNSLPEHGSFAPFPVYGQNAAEKIRDCSCTRPGTSKSGRSASTTNARENEDIWLISHGVEGIPAIDEPIPQDPSSGWTTIEDEFVGVYAMALSHIANDGPMQPRARLDDDRIYLSYIRKRDVPSRMALMKMLAAMEKSNHLKMDFLKWVDVSSFRLESFTGGKIVLDGELLQTDIIQATVSNHRTAVVADLR